MIKLLFFVLFFTGVCFPNSDVPEFHRHKIEEFYKKENIQNTKLEPLRGGMSQSFVYKLAPSYVIRLLSSRVSKEQRKNEIIFHKTFEKQGIVPKIYYIDDENDPYMIVMQFIEGRNFAPADIHDENIMNQIISSLKIIHSATLEIENTQTMLGQIENFRYDKERLPSDFERWRTMLLQDATKYESAKVPVHGDLSRWNILIQEPGNKVYFLDFQETRLDSIYPELGYFFYESGIDDKKAQQTFLKRYYGKDFIEFETEAVEFYYRVTAFACGVYLLHWIDPKYKEKELSRIYTSLAKRGVENFQGEHIDKLVLEKMSPEERVKYVLSFFKDQDQLLRF